MKNRGPFGVVGYLGAQGTPGLSEHGNARGELGSPIPPGSVGEALALIRADLGEAPPDEPGPDADLETARRALAAEDAARFARLLVVAALRAEARRTGRHTGWTLAEVWRLWLASGLNASGAIEGTWHLDKVLLRACRLGKDRTDPPTLGRANGRPNTFWVPRRQPTWDEGIGWVWRGGGTVPAHGGGSPGADAGAGKERAGAGGDGGESGMGQGSVGIALKAKRKRSEVEG